MQLEHTSGQLYQKGQVLESIYYNISQWYIPQYKLLDLFGTYETKVYNGRECYVIRKNSTDSKSLNYNECWIDKETMMNVRNVMNTQNENTQQLFIPRYNGQKRREDFQG